MHRPRLLEPPTGSFFLFGIRGVGKSTWARHRLSDAHRIDLLDEALYHDYLTQPGLFADELRARPKQGWVVVDEVQRLPNLLNEVHRFIEERGMRFALLGSSARKLKTAGTNLLAGRAVWKTLYPFVPAELDAWDPADLDATLQFGGIPLVWASGDPRATLKAYVQLYLREEIQAEALVRSLPSFARFFPVAALFHGQVLNVASLARDAGVARNTVNGYLEVLEDTLLARRLPAYEARLRARERKHPKLYWVDPGLVRAVKNQLGPLALEERGPLFEGWVHTLLRAHHEVTELFDDLYYWASPQGRTVEVDFLLQRGRELIAIEVKTQSRLAPDAFTGLKAIGELSQVRRRILLYLGDRERKTTEGIEVWPLSTFLERLGSGLL